MQEIELIPVAKGGEYIEVHPAALDEHKRLGWAECARQDQADKPKPGRKPKAVEAEQAAE